MITNKLKYFIGSSGIKSSMDRINRLNGEADKIAVEALETNNFASEVVINFRNAVLNYVEDNIPHGSDLRRELESAYNEEGLRTQINNYDFVSARLTIIRTTNEFAKTNGINLEVIE